MAFCFIFLKQITNSYYIKSSVNSFTLAFLLVEIQYCCFATMETNNLILLRNILNNSKARVCIPLLDLQIYTVKLYEN